MRSLPCVCVLLCRFWSDNKVRFFPLDPRSFPVAPSYSKEYILEAVTLFINCLDWLKVAFSLIFIGRLQDSSVLVFSIYSFGCLNFRCLRR
ncbi:hypothetical protein FKM82_028685 [Ascaphus truei]